jgi:uncharacterized membrane-anchored protein YitT (DUF2179 family)
MSEKMYQFRYLLRDFLLLFTGSIALALALVFFLVQNKIATGGVAGMAIVIHHLANLPTGLVMLIINIPLMLLGLKFLGKKFLVKTVIAIFATSFFTDFFAINLHLQRLTENLMLATIYGGVLIGIGLGLIFKGDASAGGGTILARAISQRTRFKTGQILFTIDIFVIFSAAVVFQNVELALWGFLTIFIATQIIDLILTGKPFAKVVHIMTDQVEEIGTHILTDLGRSATFMPVKEMQSTETKNLILVVVDASQIYRLRDIVRVHDPSAFMIVTDAREILGKGF